MTTTRINVDSRTILTDEGREYADIDIHIGDGIVLGLDGQPAVDLAIRILAHLASRTPSPAIATAQLEEAAQLIQRELSYRGAVLVGGAL